MSQVEKNPRGLLVAAPWSGGGKTVLTCALIRALVRRGLSVAPYKVGPDYIDPAYLAAAAGRPCYNLDPWMTPGRALRRSWARGLRGARVAVVEGVMGLYDGVGGSARGSTAEVARALGLPVVLVLPVRGFAATAAALVKGLAAYDPRISLAGVILNQVGSLRHENLLRKLLEAEGFTVLGAVPREEDFKLPSRHLGLVQAAELPLSERLEVWAERLERYVDLEGLLSLAAKARVPQEDLPESLPRPRFRLAVARDEAFSFYYQENLDLLVEAGAEVLYFSPLRDPFPEEAEALYLGGGYPELYAERLAARRAFCADLKRRLEAGLPVLAECGGFMFLLEGLEVEGRRFPLVGFLPGVARLEKGLRALGYREVRIREANPFFSEGTLARGHEFRYSRVLNGGLSGLEVRDAEGNEVVTFGVSKGSVLASYIHFHFGALEEVVRSRLASTLFSGRLS
ncbi:cobyrinate a,c-diamide synthase [Thermosulfurimonas marina]|uniref:Cobyrinate a,c-diamide synthase n=1 Tax=Thermosulfurimonas marina TaxID=2047767 RepID=A0A6H1WR08_9BACT|nr:cobyrinate a,c-diamide synthase [Thermosulfurimonas marina]QJA05623.1 cobyrinate a,c-diamide synthase [Thermosulfurimonas marina]